MGYFITANVLQKNLVSLRKCVYIFCINVHQVLHVLWCTFHKFLIHSFLWLIIAVYRAAVPASTVSPFAPFIGPAKPAATAASTAQPYSQVAPPAAPEVYNQYNYYHQTPAQYHAQHAPYNSSQYWSGEYSTQYYGYAPGVDYSTNASTTDASQVVTSLAANSPKPTA